MSFTTEVIESFISYTKRPALYPELGRKIYKNIFQRGSALKGQEKAILWCNKNSITQEEAIKLFYKEDLDIFNLFKTIL